MGNNPDRLYRLDEVAQIAGVINEEVNMFPYGADGKIVMLFMQPHRCIGSMRRQQVRCSWMQETFGEIPHGADDATIRRYARAYIMMLLGTQLFRDKFGTRLHIR
ncbi:hypothetical protein Ahy_A02g009427 [Arachis hypogaea]|uniref:Aminotransferase-like plant mobile domain-containing protein n=1 Tax=Arachis hypogaea TaxID=3818 RepID=A0A445EH23_ARAHY|nr:hypothetical protein Ahy_A02g009427 [Arachis hypogaea]